MSERQTRREFVVTALSVLAVAALPIGCAEDPQHQVTRLAALLAGTVDDKVAAKRIAEAYAKHNPGAYDTAQLVDLICGSRRRDFARAKPEQCPALLREVQAADFAQGNVVELSGWTLSRSEACLYVLAASAPAPTA